MPWVNELLLVSAIVLAAGIAATRPAARFGLPSLLIFLLVGMAFGEDGPGGIGLDNVPLAFVVGNLALALILLDGGLRTPLKTFRLGLRPAVALASFGVVLTAGLVGAFGAWALSLDWRLGLLLGAIISSTDAAGVFAMLRASGVRLNDRIAATLEIESGINDPMAIFLTLTLIDVVLHPVAPSPLQWATSFAMQFGLGAALGWAAGVVLAWSGRFWAYPDGLTTVLVAALGVAVFALVNVLGGSGFLAVYLFGVVLADRLGHRLDAALPGMDGIAWLAQSGMFLLLGLLVTPSRMQEVLVPALAIAFFLIVVARPVAVWACLAPWRFGRREVAYIGWTGLRGAVPIVLAIFPLLAGVPQADLLFHVAFVVVLVSLLVQGTSLGPVARLMHVALPERLAPVSAHSLSGGFEVCEFTVQPGSPADGRAAEALDLPGSCLVVSASRDGRALRWAGREWPEWPVGLEGTARSPDVERPSGRGVRLAAGDVVGVVGPEADVERVGVLFATPAAGPRRVPAVPALRLHATSPFREVASTYGVEAVPEVMDLALGEALERLAGRPLVEGDLLAVGRATFIVRETRDGRPSLVEMQLGVVAGSGR
jgi:potassium/hydrogen antiporter